MTDQPSMTGMSRRSMIAWGLAGAAGLAIGLTGCSARGQRDPQETPTSGPAQEGSASPAPSTDADVLLVFFSRPGENYWEGGRRDLEVGNTKRLAEALADRIGCDTYEIVAADPYSDAYDPTVQRNAREQSSAARPAISGKLPDLSRYGTVMLGSPVWNVRAPMIMSTFVESVNLEGKTVLPFVTYAVSGLAGVDEDYRDALPDSDVRDGLAVRGEEVDDAAGVVDAWLRENDLL